MKNNFEEIYNDSLKKPEEFWKSISEDVFWFKKPPKILIKITHLSTNGLKMVLLTLVTMH